MLIDRHFHLVKAIIRPTSIVGGLGEADSKLRACLAVKRTFVVSLVQTRVFEPSRVIW